MVWPHREGAGRARRTVHTPGVVIAIDKPGLPRGVEVRFDYPVNGVDTCYATHQELEPESFEEIE